MEPLKILYRDDHFVAVYKPSGIPVHASPLHPGDDNIVDLLSKQLSRPIFNTHRLDRPTSGVLVLALTGADSRILNELFRTRAVEKEYVAVVRGWFPSSLLIDRPLSKEKKGSLQDAVTRCRSLNQAELPIMNDRYGTTRYSLVSAKPETGRNHQIRRHLNGASFPIIGDTSHGDLRHNRLAAEHLGIDRLLLHAVELRFIHPVTGDHLHIRAEPDRGLKQNLEMFGFSL